MKNKSLGAKEPAYVYARKESNGRKKTVVTIMLSLSDPYLFDRRPSMQLPGLDVVHPSRQRQGPFLLLLLFLLLGHLVRHHLLKRRPHNAFHPTPVVVVVVVED